MEVDKFQAYGEIESNRRFEVLAQYAVKGSGEPIGISEYELSQVYPADFKSLLPIIEEIEKQLKD